MLFGVAPTLNHGAMLRDRHKPQNVYRIRLQKIEHVCQFYTEEVQFYNTRWRGGTHTGVDKVRPSLANFC